MEDAESDFESVFQVGPAFTSPPQEPSSVPRIEQDTNPLAHPQMLIQVQDGSKKIFLSFRNDKKIHVFHPKFQ